MPKISFQEMGSLVTQVLERDKGLCVRCSQLGIEKPADCIGWVLPLAQGGQEVKSNAEALCSKCLIDSHSAPFNSLEDKDTTSGSLEAVELLDRQMTARVMGNAATHRLADLKGSTKGFLDQSTQDFNGLNKVDKDRLPSEQKIADLVAKNAAYVLDLKGVKKNSLDYLGVHHRTVQRYFSLNHPNTLRIHQVAGWSLENGIPEECLINGTELIASNPFKTPLVEYLFYGLSHVDHDVFKQILQRIADKLGVRNVFRLIDNNYENYAVDLIRCVRVAELKRDFHRYLAQVLKQIRLALELSPEALAEAMGLNSPVDYLNLEDPEWLDRDNGGIEILTGLQYQLATGISVFQTSIGSTYQVARNRMVKRVALLNELLEDISFQQFKGIRDIVESEMMMTGYRRSTEWPEFLLDERREKINLEDMSLNRNNK